MGMADKLLQVRDSIAFMITNKSTGADWLAATPDDRRCFIERACHKAIADGLGIVSPSLAEEGITAFAAVPHLRKQSVLFLFGQVFSACHHMGHYRRLLDELRKGP